MRKHKKTIMREKQRRTRYIKSFLDRYFRWLCEKVGVEKANKMMRHKLSVFNYRYEKEVKL